MKQLTFAIITLLFACTHLWAQTGIIYSCDFEDATERSQWVLNATANPQLKANLTNFWNMGAPGHFAPTGSWGLYIGTSESATVSAYDGSKTIENLAYRVLPEMEAGSYTLTFDWLANCKGGQEGLYACLVPADVNTYSGATALTMAWFKQYVLPMSIDTVLHATSTWSVATLKFTTSVKAQFKLVLVFFTTRGAAVGPAPAVDNICLFESGHCEAPTDISHMIVDQDVKLQWKGNADSYDIRTYNYETHKWQETTAKASSKSIQSALISNVEEGIGVFFLRSHCGTYTSEWVKYEKFIFHKGIRCIDYMDLNKNNCAYGTTSNPAATKGVVDFGYADKYSRHTLHYVLNEIDPRTVTEDGKYMLKTKPDDALASVRLGNWDIGAQAEQITYTYKVSDDGNAVLQLRYAVVIQDPAHEATAQPRFTLSILHNGQKLPGGCGEANFAAEGHLTAEDGWHEAGEGNNKLFWKEWTTVSVNLQEYIGQTITIKLTTYDCTASGHYGYAYFTLGCSNGEMSGLNCGEDEPTTQFIAPEGFNYAWYLPDNPGKILSKDQIFTIGPMDTLTYNVDIINKTNGQCYYTLTACGMPRIPVPQTSYSSVAEHCENVVTFVNESYVKLKNQITKKYYRSNEKITSLYWDFGDGKPVLQSLDSIVRHTYPPQGGDYTLRLSAGISDDACIETIEVPIHLPDLHVPETSEHVHACHEQYPFGYNYEGVWYHTDTAVDVTLQSLLTECDSIVHFTLQWSDTLPHPASYTMCEGQSYQFGDTTLTEAGVYQRKFKDAYGCDSLVHLTLTTTPTLIVETNDTFYMCADNRSLDIPYLLLNGQFNQMIVRFDAKAQAKGMDAEYSFAYTPEQIATLMVPSQVDPTILNARLEFTPAACSESDKDIRIELRYATSIYKQKDGMLAVMNEKYNGGGYLFDSFQWYCDDQPIQGANLSVLSVTDANKGRAYSVELIRSNDPDRVPTRACDIIYGTAPAQSAPEQTSNGPYSVYTPSGRKLGTWSQMNEISGLEKGLYIVRDAQDNVYKLFY